MREEAGRCQLTLVDFLGIEDDPKILDFRCPDTALLLWPLLRNQLLRSLAAALFYNGVPVISAPQGNRYGKALAALPRALWINARGKNRMAGEILVMATGAGHFQKNGQSFNRITDYFAMEAESATTTIEGLMDWRIPDNVRNSRVFYFLPWQGKIDLFGKLARRDRHTKVAADLMEFVRGRAADLLGLTVPAAQSAYLVSMLAAKIARLPTMLETYRRLLEKVSPRLVLLEQACYGDLGVFNLVARTMGIRIAEPQHGLISKGHDAYSYSKVLRQSQEYATYLPHDFLGYGAWWNEQINAPVAKWTIGHPHYVEQRASFGDSDAIEKRDIVLLSDGFEFQKYLDLAIKLNSRTHARYRVVLRPHPLERERVRSEFAGKKLDGVTIDYGRDIYVSFRSAFAVLGELSTGLFEAIGVVEKIFIWATPKAAFSCPEHPFSAFTDDAELAHLISTPGDGVCRVDVEAIWASDWRTNYKRYLQTALEGLPTGSMKS